MFSQLITKEHLTVDFNYTHQKSDSSISSSRSKKQGHSILSLFISDESLIKTSPTRTRKDTCFNYIYEISRLPSVPQKRHHAIHTNTRRSCWVIVQWINVPKQSYPNMSLLFRAARSLSHIALQQQPVNKYTKMAPKLHPRWSCCKQRKLSDYWKHSRARDLII